MKDSRREINLGGAGEKFPEGTHMCLIYDNDDDRDRVLAKYLSDGIVNGEHVGYFADTSSPEEIRKLLNSTPADIPDAEELGDQFEIFNSTEVYCPNGEFDPQHMLEHLKNHYRCSMEAGYTGCRFTGEMTWALKGIPGSERLVEYESLVNTINIEYPGTPICQYDARKFDGATLLKILRVHPLMIVNGQVVHNPYYVPPEEFLESNESTEI